MTIIGLIIALAVIGLVLYLVTMIPMDEALAKLIRVVGIVIAVVLVIVWVLGVAGMGAGLGNIHIK
jgi:hypothetical protein